MKEGSRSRGRFGTQQEKEENKVEERSSRFIEQGAHYLNISHRFKIFQVN